MTQDVAPTAETRTGELLQQLFLGGLQDPYPTYAELRELGDGIHWVDLLQGYLVMRYDDVRTVAGDWETFSSEVFWNNSPSIHNPEEAEHLRFIDIASQLFMFADPPTHTRIRSTFRHAFTPSAVEAWKPLIASVTERLLERYQRGVELDIMPNFAADVPVAVIASILGVPEEMWPKFREWSYGYASTFDPIVQGEQRDRAITASLELFDYLRALVIERKAEPRDDLVSMLVATETVDGDVLGETELLAQIALLLVAGNETTTTLIGTGLTLLFDNPDAFAALREDRSLIPDAIEEMLRIDPPLHLNIRKTTKDVVLGDHEIPAGSVLWLCVAAANRDPRRFEDPDRFVIDRPDNKHLAFLHGIHFCVGAPLGRMEGQVVFDRILDGYPDIRPGAVPAQRRTSNVVARGWDTRPVIL